MWSIRLKEISACCFLSRPRKQPRPMGTSERGWSRVATNTVIFPRPNDCSVVLQSSLFLGAFLKLKVGFICMLSHLKYCSIAMVLSSQGSDFVQECWNAPWHANPERTLKALLTFQENRGNLENSLPVMRSPLDMTNLQQ